ncbi:hypothetical protein ACVOMV_19090 [Mesorhizobium atlanticum]
MFLNRLRFDKSGWFRVYGIRRRFDGIALSNFRENAALHFGLARSESAERDAGLMAWGLHRCGPEMEGS